MKKHGGATDPAFPDSGEGNRWLNDHEFVIHTTTGHVHATRLYLGQIVDSDRHHCHSDNTSLAVSVEGPRSGPENPVRKQLQAGWNRPTQLSYGNRPVSTRIDVVGGFQ